MKTFLAFAALSSAALAPIHAQVFRPETVNGAVLGGIAGAVIGNNSGDLRHNAWKGAAIGTVAGALIGSAVGDARHDADRRVTQVPRPMYLRSGYDSGYDRHRYGHARHGYGRGYGYAGPSWGYYSGRVDGYHGSARDFHYGPRYVYRAPVYLAGRPSHASRGIVLGGLAGAIIGHNSGDLRHNGWRGAAWGAGAGWLLGAIADDRASHRDRVVEIAPDSYAPEQAPAPAPSPAAAAPQNVTIINNYYGTNSTPMTAANGLFGR